MNLLTIVLLSAVVLLAAYFIYGRVLARLLRLNPDAPTPAVQLRDDVDYVPIEPKFLLSQHFSAIAAAGPIVGPILAGMWFGWAPALIWILLGSILIGGVHDITALVASIRHKARSIAEVVRDHMTRRSYVVFLAFVWLSLVYIIVAFTDITASSFLGTVATLDDGTVITGEGIATSSLLYLALPIIMGLLLRYTKLTVGWATLIFLPLVGVAIWIGQSIPFDLAGSLDLSRGSAHKAWDVLLLVYCFVASIIPMWLLLQPRGHLGGYFLFLALGGGMLGVILGGQDIEYPAFIGWESRSGTLFPILFITIACGACSGFHAIIASGTTSKQLRRETDAKMIGYGSMLLEAMVAIVSLGCVMIYSAEAIRQMQSAGSADPNVLYARGIGSFLSVLGIPMAFGISFGLMAFTTFVYDTLDVCTRLGRYILQELFSIQGKGGRWIATGLTAGVPLVFLLWQPVGADGAPVPAWRTYWALFGASNQLLAALTLMGVTVWLWRTRRAWWVWLVTGLPTVWMYTMSMWALALMIGKEVLVGGEWQVPSNPVPWVALVLAGLGALMLVEAVRVLLGPLPRPPASEPEPVAAPA